MAKKKKKKKRKKSECLFKMCATTLTRALLTVTHIKVNKTIQLQSSAIVDVALSQLELDI